MMERFWITNPTASETTDSSKDLFGGKGWNLFKLQRWGLLVPEFGVLTSKAYAEWMMKGQLPPGTLEEMGKSI